MLLQFNTSFNMYQQKLVNSRMGISDAEWISGLILSLLIILSSLSMIKDVGYLPVFSFAVGFALCALFKSDLFS